MLVLAVVMIASASLSAFADGEPAAVVTGWARVNSEETGGKTRWCYYNAEGQLVKSVKENTRNKWVDADGKRFYFSKKKKPVGQGFRMIRDKLYYFDWDGSLVYGTFMVNNEEIKTTPAGNITGLPYYRYKYRYTRFVFIDLSEQKLEFYKKGKLKRRCPVVTGNVRRGWNTPAGRFRVTHKVRNAALVNGDKVAHVTYWMSFIRNEYGMHDASWRGPRDFKNSKTYKRRGSHGCVNMRRADAAYLYGQVSVGTPVIIQK